MLAASRCLLRLGFRVCSYDLVLLASYACMRKMRSYAFWVAGVDVCFVYGLRFIHMV